MATVRAQMLELGWESNDRLSKSGWYSIWFDRYDWHGWVSGNKVTFHAHTNNLSQASINKTIKKAAELAKQAWKEYPDHLPFLGADGKIHPVESYLHESWLKRRKQRRIF